MNFEQLKQIALCEESKGDIVTLSIDQIKNLIVDVQYQLERGKLPRVDWDCLDPQTVAITRSEHKDSFYGHTQIPTLVNDDWSTENGQYFEISDCYLERPIIDHRKSLIIKPGYEPK
ncbi:MAG: hypothetical protein ACJAYB_000102 [Psychromonas sp.]|jgi:hypothetical protein